MEYDKFEALRRELYEEVQLENYESKDFKERFLKLLEMCNLSLMNDSDNFFGLFFIQLKREMNFKISTAVETKLSGTYFTMYFNPCVFLECTLKEMQALIKHDIYHIMSKHYIRARKLKYKYNKLAINLAMDIAINQYLMYLPSWSAKLENVKLAYNIDLKEDQTMEQYAYKIQKAIDKKNKKEDKFEEKYSKIHEIWDDMNEVIDMEQMEEIIKKIAVNSFKGKVPESIGILMKALNNVPEITWKDYLKRIIGTLPEGHKKTITRKDRRQPYRLDIRGRLSNRIVKVLIAIDISGSMTDQEIEKSMTEILSIVRNYPFEISVVECDDNIKRIYKVKNIKDVKEKINTKGGTKYSPVFQYIYDKKLRDSVVIFFTDGAGEEELKVKPYNYKTIWVLTGANPQLSIKNPMGPIVKLNNSLKNQEKVNGYDLIRDAMKDIRSEWAK